MTATLSGADLVGRGDLVRVESADERRARLSTGSLIVATGLLLAGLSFNSGEVANFALSNAFDEVVLPTVVVPEIGRAHV